MGLERGVQVLDRSKVVAKLGRPDLADERRWVASSRYIWYLEVPLGVFRTHGSSRVPLPLLAEAGDLSRRAVGIHDEGLVHAVDRPNQRKTGGRGLIGRRRLVIGLAEAVPSWLAASLATEPELDGDESRRYTR